MTKRLACAALCALTALLLCACAARPSVVYTSRPEGTRLTVLFGESTSDPGVGDMLRAHIEEHFPQVELEWESVDWGEQFSGRLNAKIASGEAPDLIIGKAQDVQAYHALDALGAFPDDFASLLTEQGQIASMADGRLYGLTYNQIYQGVLYNKNIFYRFNLQPPETLEELYAIVERLEGAGQVAFGTHFQETWYMGNILMQFALNEVFSQVPDWGDRLRAGERSFSTDPAYRACAQQASYVLAHTWPDAASVSNSEATRRFADEEAAMYLTGSWSVQTLQSIAPYRKIGFFPFPTRSGDARLIVEPNTTFMKSAATPHDALIDEICRSILTDGELAETLCAFTQTDSTLSAASASDTLSMIREDIDRYAAQDRLISASVGNNQIVWAYQYTCAEMLLEALESGGEIDEVLQEWDALRGESLLGP